MFETVIVVRKQGQKIPKDFIDHLIACQFTAGFGIRMAIGGQIKGGATNQIIDWDTVEGSQSDGVQDLSAVYAFHKCDHDIDASEAMPYVLLGPDEDPILVAYGNGLCPQHEKMQMSTPPIAIGIENVLKPFIKMVYKITKGDLKATLENIRDEESYGKIMSELFGSNSTGSLILLANDGDIIPYNNQSDTKDLSWGWVNDTHGYEVTKKATTFNFAIGAAKGPTSSVADKPKVTDTPAKPVETKPAPASVPEVKPKEDKTDTAAAAAMEAARKVEAARVNQRRGINAAELAEGKEMTVDHLGLIYPPLNLAGDKNKSKAWYHKQGGNPHFHEMEKDNRYWKDTLPGIKPRAPAVIIRDVKDLANHHIETVPAKVDAVLNGVIPAAVKEKFLADFANKAENKVALDQSSGGIPEPKAFQGFEGEFPKFEEQTGIKIEDTLGYTLKALHELVVKFPQLAAILMHEQRNLLVSFLVDPVKFKEPAVDKTVTATTNTEVKTKQITAPSAAPVTATNRGPLFKFNKVS